MKKSSKFMVAELLTLASFLTVGVSSVSASGTSCHADSAGTGVRVENTDLGGMKCQSGGASGLACSKTTQD